MKRVVTGLVLILLLVALSPEIHAYPSAEVLGTGSTNPPFDFGISSTPSGFILISDRRLAVSFSESLKLIDLGTYALESTQPAALSTTDETDGIIGGIAYSSDLNKIFAPQEDGDLLVFDLANISAKPTSTEIVSGNKLGPIVIDTNASVAYIADNTAKAIQVVTLSSATLSSTIALTIPNLTSFTITDGVYDDDTREVYFTTSVGRVFYIASGGSTATRIDYDATGQKNLSAIAATPAGDFVYAVDSTTPVLVKISTSSHTVVKSDIAISANPSPTDIVISDVTGPSATYAFVAGAATPSGGISVIDTADDDIFDLGSDADVDDEALPVSASPLRLAASSSSDGYVYMAFSTGKLGIISEKPFITISGVTFSDGSTSLKQNQTMTMTFKSNQTGTYTIKAGGDVTGSGTALTDSSGNTSGTATADTDVTVTISHSDNSSVFSEGTNDVWVFVTSGSNMGRRATAVTLDTPPPNVVITSTGFGNERIYVNFERLTTADLASYRVYVDTDPAAVLIKSDIATTVAQASSGDTQTAEVGGLVNGTTYYVAMEAVDSGGNISPSRTNTFADGSPVSASPEETVGPVGMLGEKGCQLIRTHFTSPSPLRGEGRVRGEGLVCITILCSVITIVCLRRRHSISIFIITIGILFSPLYADAGDRVIEERPLPAAQASGAIKQSPQMWEMEMKTGFWLPQNSVLERYFTNCCNMITRIEGGLLLHRRYGVDGSLGFMYKSARALGVSSGGESQDRFNFILIPMATSFVWRADYFDWRYLVPFARAGIDYVYFREGDKGKTTQGVKFGLHGGGGVGINIGEMGDVAGLLDTDFDINDFFLTIEARYQWIDNFGGHGLDLSGGVYSIGFLFEF